MIANRIKEYRLKNELTQQELAELVDVRRETISRLEKQLYNPSLELALKIADIFGQDVQVLFQLKKEGSKPK